MVKAYPKYKDSEAPWLGKVPENWDVLPTRTLFAEVKEREHVDEKLLSVTISQGVIRQEDLISNSSKKDSSNEDKSKYKLVEPGDIAYNKMRAWQGAIGISQYRGIVSPAYIVVRPRRELNARYFHYLLRTPAFAKEAERWSYGITSDQWSLRPEHFKMIYCSVPSEKEQDSIVKFLDNVDIRVRRYIRDKQQVIKLLNEQKQAIINRAIARGIDRNVKLKPSGVKFLGDIPAHWEVRKIKQTTNLIVSNVDKHTFPEELPVRLCNYVDIYKNERIRADMNFMRATATPDEVLRFKLRMGDVVITKDSEEWTDIAVPALVEYEANDFVCGYHLAILRPDIKKIESEFLFRVLQSSVVASQFHVSANGVTRYGLSHQAIKDVLIPVPPLEEQRKIIAYISEGVFDFQRIIESASAEIDLIKEYRLRLHSDVVTGKIDVRNIKLPDLQEETPSEPIDDEETSAEIEDAEEPVNADE